VVRKVLAENDGRWEALSEADRTRLAAMARSIVGRLLHEPTLRLKQGADGDDVYLHVQALRELFGLEGEGGMSAAREIGDTAGGPSEAVTPLDARRAAARARRSADSSGR
jgi:glutamyl-tRNA reductase